MAETHSRNTSMSSGAYMWQNLKGKKKSWKEDTFKCFIKKRNRGNR